MNIEELKEYPSTMKKPLIEYNKSIFLLSF